MIALWLGGLGCGLCCGLEIVAACFDEKPVLSCHSTAHVDHCQKQTSDAQSTDSISGQASLKDCSLLPNQATSLAVTSRAVDAHALPEYELMPTEGIIFHKEVFIPDPLPPNRGQVYLQLCALLI
jgi:hypothetical protein